MMNPLAPFLETGMHQVLPVLVLMFGALILGTLIGWSSAPSSKSELTRLRSELERERKTLNDARTRLDKTGALLKQRQLTGDTELAVAQRGTEHELSTLNAEIVMLKTALAAAKRPAPVPHEDTFRHATRLAELEREAARVPKLQKELEALRAQSTQTKRASKPQPLPQQVYQLMSSTFGKRIAPDDLQLVEGIGPKIAEHLAKHGLKTWTDLAAAKPAQLRKVLDSGGDRFQLHDPTHWPEQCKLMVENRWEELRKYQRKLSNAR